MREILFKAKRIDNGKWVEGYYVRCVDIEGYHYIYTGRLIDAGFNSYDERHEIDPRTLCQYTGLTDKNGQKIWENDVC